jgi:hypothetical protein
MTRSAIQLCERCSHPREDVEGFVVIHKGGSKTAICFACIDDLKVIADQVRRQPPSPLPKLRVISP